MQHQYTGLLVTGFGPFGKIKNNPSGYLAKLVSSRLPGSQFLVLPTSYRRSVEELDSFVTRCKPTAILMLGYSGQANPLKIERKGRAVSKSTSTDIDGQTWGHTTNPSQIRTKDRTTTVNVDGLLEPARRYTSALVSEDAGGFVCNAAYFHVLGVHPNNVVFVHVGPNPGDVLQNLELVEALQGIAATIAK